jgi:hypothetical protein
MLGSLALLLACDASVSYEPAAPIPEEEIPRPPDGAILINGVEYPLAVGSYCWGGSTRVLCVDTIGYITVLPYAQARSGDVVTLAGPLAALQFDRGFVGSVPRRANR